MASQFSSYELPGPLSVIFSNTRNSYKFYWFLSLLDKLDERDLKVKVADVLTGMVEKVWYPINYFKISLGGQDQLAKVVEMLMKKTGLKEDASPYQISEAIKNNFEDKKISKPILSLGDYVPYRLIRPWFPETRKLKDQHVNKAVAQLSHTKFHDPTNFPLYKIQDGFLFFNHRWLDYLRSHKKILQEYTYWELLNYVQKLNPNVPNLGSKLFRPQKRKLEPARKFWLEVATLKPIRCIYSQQILRPDDFSIDHFLPWSYVTHDQKWNLTPTTKSINSSKSNVLPSLETYGDPFIDLQREAYHVYYKEGSLNKPLEDYAMYFKLSFAEIRQLSAPDFHELFSQNLTPQFQIAESMGFPSNWQYSP